MTRAGTTPAVWRASVLAFVLSLLCTMLFSVVLPARYRGNDSTDYIDFYQPVAHNILNGDGYTLHGALTTLYPPGYPLLLAGLFRLAHMTGLSEQTAVYLLSVVGMAIASAMLCWLSSMVWPVVSGLVPALVWATCPFALWLTKQPNTEIPFVVLMLGAFLVFWRALEAETASFGSYLSVGILIGLATLIRPIAVGLGLVMAALLFILGRLPLRTRIAGGAVLLLANIAAILPWQIWINSKTDQRVFLGTASVGLLRAGLTFDVNLKGYRQSIPIPADVRVFMEDTLKEYPHLQTTGDVARLVLDNIRSRPVTMAKLFAIKSVRSWYGTDSQNMEKPLLLIQIFYLVFAVWASRRAWRQGGYARDLVGAVWLIVLYFWAIDTIGHPFVRYMLPAEGLLFVLFAAFVPAEIRVPSFLKQSDGIAAGIGAR